MFQVTLPGGQRRHACPHNTLVALIGDKKIMPPERLYDLYIKGAVQVGSAFTGVERGERFEAVLSVVPISPIYAAPQKAFPSGIPSRGALRRAGHFA